MAGFRIEAVHVFAAVDPKDGDEGIAGALGRDGKWVPFIAADEERLRSIRPLAEAVGRALGVEMRLLRFSVREELEVIEP